MISNSLIQLLIAGLDVLTLLAAISLMALANVQICTSCNQSASNYGWNKPSQENKLRSHDVILNNIVLV